ncbi:MAG: hypothetical protein HKN29_05720 [Rhodothermales bacterium]|nr:hypothetical protein [Rhodothermales bacterium]
MMRLFLLLMGTLLAAPAAAQISAAEPLLIDYPFPTVTQGSVDFGDLDGDGDLDFVVTGLRLNETPVTRVFKLVDSTYVAGIGGFFTQLSFKVYQPVPAVLNQVWNGAARWGDADGDGDGDLLLFGLNIVERVVGQPQTETVGELYLNNGLNLVRAEVDLPGLYGGDAAWGDYDADGDLDFAACGASSLVAPYAPQTLLYRNDGSGFFQVDSALPGVSSCQLDWGDLDGDGDLDLALTGESDSGPIAAVFERRAGDTFIDLEVDLPTLYLADLDWGDFDGDGRDDLVISGGVLDPNLLRGSTTLLRSTPTGMREVPDPGLSHLLAGGVAWTDYDVDGDLDVIVTGAETVLGRRAGAVLINEGGTFRTEFILAGLTQGDLAVGDYNDDGDDDFFILGLNDEGLPFGNFIMNQTFPEIVPPGFVRR